MHKYSYTGIAKKISKTRLPKNENPNNKNTNNKNTNNKNTTNKNNTNKNNTNKNNTNKNNTNKKTTRQQQMKSRYRKKKVPPDEAPAVIENKATQPAAKLIYYAFNSETSLSNSNTPTSGNSPSRDKVQDIVNHLLSDDSSSQPSIYASTNSDLQGKVIFHELKGDTAEIGVVDITPERKQMDYVTRCLNLKMNALERYCRLFNKPECISGEHLRPLNSFLLKLSSLRSNIFTKIITTLERNGLLTHMGVHNVFQLLSNKSLARAPITKTSVETVRSTNNFSRFLCPPFNLISTTKLSNMLERLRLNRQLTEAEGEKLTAYVFALLKLRSNALTAFLKMLVGNNLVTHAQMEKFLQILSQQNKNGHRFDGILTKFKYISAINAEDLAKLLNRWPRVDSTKEIMRLRTYLRILNNVDGHTRQIFISALREYGYLDAFKSELLAKLLMQSKRLRR